MTKGSCMQTLVTKKDIDNKAYMKRQVEIYLLDRMRMYALKKPGMWNKRKTKLKYIERDGKVKGGMYQRVFINTHIKTLAKWIDESTTVTEKYLSWLISKGFIKKRFVHCGKRRCHGYELGWKCKRDGPCFVTWYRPGVRLSPGKEPKERLFKEDKPKVQEPMKKYVYFFQEMGAGGRIKIGRSDNVIKRFKTLNQQSPYGLKALGYIRTNGNKHLTEWNIINRLKESRVKGEWLEQSEEVYLFIDSLKNDGLWLELRT